MEVVTPDQAPQEEAVPTDQTPPVPPTPPVDGFLKKGPSLKDKVLSVFEGASPLKKVALLLGGILLLGGLLFFGWFIFSKATGKDLSVPSFTLSGGDTSLGNVEKASITHPINGLQYTSSQAKEWEARRPLAVMINNHSEARPQKGLSYADLIYEAVAEGGISRFVGIFHSKIPEVVGPVRSARVYYIDWAKEYDAWYAHWGHAQTANEANAFARMQSIFVSSIESANACEYDESLDRALEHTLYCEPETLYETAYSLYSDQPVEFQPLESWKFKSEKVEADLTNAAQKISFNFWDLPEYEVEWRYNAETNTYERYQGGELQVDALNSKALTAGNIIVVYMQERHLNDEKQHLIYEDLGTGDAVVFLDGRVIEAEWKRLAYGDRTIFTDSETGEEIEFSRGQVWIEILPDINDTLSYE